MINKKFSDNVGAMISLICMVIISSFAVILMFLQGSWLLALFVGLLFMGIPITIIVGIATGWLTAIRTSSNSWRIARTSKMKTEVTEQQKMPQLMTQQEKLGIVEPVIERAAVPSVRLCTCCGAAVDSSCKECPECHTTLD